MPVAFSNICLLICLGFAVFVPKVNAGTILYVDGSVNSDDGTGTISQPFIRIQEALTYCINDNIIMVAPYTYIYDYGIVVSTGSCTLQGNGPADLVIVDGSQNSHGNWFISLSSRANLTIANLTIQFFQTTAIQVYGNLVLDNCELLYNYAISGGAVSCVAQTGTYFQPSCSFISTLFKSNQAASGMLVNSANVGGAIFSNGAMLNVVDCNFMFNSGYYGGAIYATTLSGSTSTVSIVSSSFSINSANSGGALYFTAADSAAMTNVILDLNCSFVENDAIQGGAIRVTIYSQLNSTSSLFSQNTAQTGGAVFIDTAGVTQFTLDDFDQNSATLAGGAINYDTSGFQSFITVDFLSITDSNFTSNVASSGRGGAIAVNSLVDSPALIAENVLFSSNSANFGAGVSGQSYAVLILTNATFENMACLQGCGVYAGDNVNVTIIGGSATGNTATVSGGWLYATSSATISVSQTTITDNTAVISGGSIELEGNSVSCTINNLLASGSSAGSGGFLSAVVTSTGQSEGELTVTMEDVLIANSVASNSGGAMIVGSEFSIYLTNVTFFNNTAQQNGGAIMAQDSVYLQTSQLNLTLNTAGQLGGAIYLTSATPSNFTTTSFIGNQAVVGGSIAIFQDIDNVFTTSLFTDNLAEYGGAIFACSLDNQTVFSDVKYVNNSATVFPDYGSNAYMGKITFPNKTNSVLSGHIFSVLLTFYDLQGNLLDGNSPQSSVYFDIITPLNHSTSQIITSSFVNGVFEAQGLLAIGASGSYNLSMQSVQQLKLVNMPSSCLAQAPDIIVETVPFTILPCPPGSQIDSTYNCFQCSPGHFSSGDNSLSCDPCSAGYIPNVDQTACVPCPLGYYAAANGSITCSLCNQNTYTYSVGSPECLTCPTGGDCFSAANITASTGYYLFRIDAEESVVFGECKSGHCVNGTCAPSYTGELCGSCSPPYVNWQGDCIICDGPQGENIVGYIAVYFALATLYVFSGAGSSAIFSSVWFCFQVLSLFYSGSLDLVSIGLGFLNFRPSCLGPIDVYAQFWLAIANFGFLLFCSAFIWILDWFYRKSALSEQIDRLIEYLLLQVKNLVVSLLDRITSLRWLVTFAVKFNPRLERGSVSQVAYNCFVSAYLPTLFSILIILDCRENYPGSGVTLLYVDQSIVCSGYPYAPYKILSYVLTVVLFVVPPIVVGIWTQQLLIQGDTHESAHLFAIFHKTKKHLSPYLQPVLLIRRAAVAIFVTFVQSSNIPLFFMLMQILFTCLLMLQVLLWPFRNFIENLIETIVLASLCLTFFIAPVGVENNVTELVPDLLIVVSVLVGSTGIALWVVSNFVEKYAHVKVKTGVTALSVTDDGKVLLVGYRTGKVGAFIIKKKAGEQNLHGQIPEEDIRLVPLPDAQLDHFHKGDDVVGFIPLQSKENSNSIRFLSYGMDHQILLWEIKGNINTELDHEGADANENIIIRRKLILEGHINSITSVAVETFIELATDRDRTSSGLSIPEPVDSSKSFSKSFVKRSRFCVSGSNDGRVFLWDLSTLNTGPNSTVQSKFNLATLFSEPEKVREIKYNSDSTAVIWISDSAVYVVDVSALLSEPDNCVVKAIGFKKIENIVGLSLLPIYPIQPRPRQESISSVAGSIMNSAVGGIAMEKLITEFFVCASQDGLAYIAPVKQPERELVTLNEPTTVTQWQSNRDTKKSVRSRSNSGVLSQHENEGNAVLSGISYTLRNFFSPLKPQDFELLGLVVVPSRDTMPLYSSSAQSIGDVLLTYNGEGRVVIWRLKDLLEQRVPSFLKDDANYRPFAPSLDKNIHIATPGRNSEGEEVPRPVEYVVPLKQEGKRQLFIAISKETISIWNFVGRRLSTFYGHHKPISKVAVTPDESLMFTTSDENVINVYAIKKGLDNVLTNPLDTRDRSPSTNTGDYSTEMVDFNVTEDK